MFAHFAGGPFSRPQIYLGPWSGACSSNGGLSPSRGFIHSCNHKESGENLDQQEREAERGKSQALARQVEIPGLKVKDLAVDFDDGVVTVSGSTPSQEERENVILVLGNTQGVARVEDRLIVEVAEPEATLYTVKSGDSLSAIAKAHYGDAMKYPVIFEANRPMLSDPDKIYPGQVLRLP